MSLVQKSALDAIIGVKAFALMLVVTVSPCQATVSNTATKSDAGQTESSKFIEITMAVREANFRVGEVVVLAGLDGSLHRLQKESFLAVIQPMFRLEAFEGLSARLPNAQYISLNEIADAGLKVAYDDNALAILIKPTVEQRPRGEIRGRLQTGQLPKGLANPAEFSGFLNAHAGIGYERSQTDKNGAFKFPTALFDGALHWKEMTLEGDAQLTADGSFSRGSTRLVHDIPEYAIRASWGDINIRSDGLFAMPALFGMAIERSYADLRPSQNIRPTGKRSFRIENSSDVRILVNGNEIRRLQLPPGEYDLDDLPLTGGTNNIEVLIKDEFGNEEKIDFSVLFNRALLQAGMSEWSIAAGKKIKTGDGALSYTERDPALVASIRTGISETFTSGFGVQLSKQAKLTGFTALQQTSFGLLGFTAASSIKDGKHVGWSLGGEFDFDNAVIWDDAASLQLGAEYRSRSFISSLNDAMRDASQFRLQGAINQPLPRNTNISLSGYYSFSPLDLEQRFGASVSVTRSISDDMSLGLSASYDSKDEKSQNLTPYDGFSLFARLRYKPTLASSFSYQYDAVSKTSIGSFQTSLEDGSSRASVGVDLEHIPRTSSGKTEHVAGADLHIASSRYELNASHSQHVQGIGQELYNSRSTINLGIGIGYADDQFAFGRPIRNAFAIVDTHESLSDSTVRISPFENTYRAEVDDFGPALIPDISTYTKTNLPYSIDDAPIGYDFGSGAFDLLASYKSGYHLTIGSDFSVTAVGTLTNERNEQLSLKAGQIYSKSFQDKKIAIFTNSAGRFSAQGLKAGEWIIEMKDQPIKHYVLQIPDDTNNFVQLGNLKPQKM